MKIIKIIILTSFILANNGIISCNNSDKNANKIIVQTVANDIIKNVVNVRIQEGYQIDSIYLICKKPLLLIDSSSNKIGKYYWGDIIFDNPAIVIVETEPDFSMDVETRPDLNSRLFKENVNAYLFVKFDSITVGKALITANVEFGTSGSREVVEFSYYLETLDLVSKVFNETIQR